MATTTRKSRQSISYVLPLENSSGGHRLGVNSLAVDPRGILYSAGRDGLICSWDIGADLSNPKAHGDGRPTLPPTTFREEIQAHNHWINDIALCYSNEAVVSCSSDLKVKLWRPQSTQGSYLIGHHTDYVKCLAAPSVHSDWVASAGLDRTVRVWDLNTASEKLKMNVKVEDDKTSQSNLSIYSLAVGMEGSIIASGGPEKVVRLWDARSGEKIGKFIGHTDNIRSILVSEQNGIVVTASTDKTIKFWSIPQNRCLQTLSMHNESVWSLYSDHPTLDIFYSSDRSGMVVKTDIRNVTDLGDDHSVNNEGLCLNIAQDNEAINKVMPCGGYIWTASASSGIKRWLDVDTDAELVFPETPKADRRPRVTSSASTRPRGFTASSAGGASFTAHSRPTIPRTALMRMIERSTRSSNVRDPDAVTVYSVTSGRQHSVAETLMETEEAPIVPFNERPQETTTGARGLLKHHVLNDRRRCLTVDTEGEVEMWDLITCIPIKNFGKRHLDDVVMEVNTLDQISNWSTVNCQTGRLAVLLEENSCFDSEQYWDEAGIPEHIEVPADQRINFGKWVLRYMFGNFLDEQIRRDATYRKTLEVSRQERERLKISLPPPPSTMVDMASPLTTPTAKTPLGGRYGLFPQTPGLGIGIATPMPLMSPWDDADRSSAGRSSGDYFSHAAAGPSERPSSRGRVSGDDSAPSEPAQEKPTGIFGNLKWGGFGGKKLGRSASTDMGAPVNKGVPIAGIPDSSLDIPHSGGIGSGASGSGTGAAGTDDEEKNKDFYAETIAGVLVRLRTQYDAITTSVITSNLTPSLPGETPFLRLPRGMNIFINDDQPGFAHAVDIWSTTVGGCGDKESADELERIAPSWLGELLLHNRCPLKETVKVAFILMPWQEGDGGDVKGNKYTIMPTLMTENGSDTKPARLNANRMLRAKKIRGYVVEHLPQGYGQGEPDLEELVELVCNGTVIPPTVTLATIKHYVWKNSNSDVALLYRRRVPPPTPTDG